MIDLTYVLVHYRAWTESTQHKFEDTWNEQRPLELVLGKGIYLVRPVIIETSNICMFF